jgi:hypothetical protein
MKDYKDKIYPELTEAGEKQACELLDRFKESMEVVMKNVAKKCLDDFYSDIMPYIQSDSWLNYRNNICDAIQDYAQFKEMDKHEAKRIRDCIFKNNKKELIEDLNKDLLSKIEDLEEQLENAREFRGY